MSLNICEASAFMRHIVCAIAVSLKETPLAFVPDPFSVRKGFSEGKGGSGFYS
jgi:hypothetical protein